MSRDLESHNEASPRRRSFLWTGFNRRSSMPPVYQSVATLPVYPDTGFSAPVQETHDSRRQHEWNLTSGSKNRAWATLRLLSSASSSTQRPRYMGGDPVEGCVKLDLDRPQTIISVNILLRGRMITSSWADGSHVFLDHSIPIWSRDRGDPRRELPSPGPSSSFDGKLNGSYEWPFSFPFPTEIQVPQRGTDQAQSFPTPPTFLERGINASIQYEIVLRLNVGLLHSKTKLQANTIFVPLTVAPPGSPLRQQAYLTGQFLPGPSEDPIGWTSAAPLVIRGYVLPSREIIQLELNLSLAAPPSYSRGTVVPCYLAIRSSNANDRQLESILAAPFYEVFLVRRVTYLNDARQGSAVKGGVHALTMSGQKSVGMVDDFLNIGTAVWWTPSGPLATSGNTNRIPGFRALEGEIHLEPTLQPSCALPFFVIDYTVKLSATSSQAFEPLPATGSKGEGMHVSFPVNVTTVHGQGPLPTAFTPRSPSGRTGLAPDEIREVEFRVPLNTGGNIRG